jgi:hypothetical protein
MCGFACPSEYTTEDGYKMIHIYSDEAVDVEEVTKKVKAALDIDLRTMVIPKRIMFGGYDPNKRYDLHFYKCEKIKEGE